MEKMRATYEVQRVIRWITETDRIEKFVESIRFSGSSGDKNTVLEKKSTYIFDHKVGNGRIGAAEYEIDNEMMLSFCEFLGERKKHLQRLIDESNEEYVELARAYIAGKLEDLVEK